MDAGNSVHDHDLKLREISMNKLFFAAGTAALAFVNAAAGSTAEANRFLLRRGFKNLLLRRASRPNADAAASIDSQPADEKAWDSDRHQSALCDLAARHPQVIAISLFSRKHR